MKRQTFMTIAATVGTLFSVYMIAAPAKMMEGMGSTASDTTNVVLQAMSVMLFSTAVITFLARKDEGSIALLFSQQCLPPRGRCVFLRAESNARLH